MKAEDIFKVCGKALRRIRISERDTAVDAESTRDPASSFKNLLALITKYCQPGKLNELHLEYRSTLVRGNILLPALPYFTSLKKLTLKRHGNLVNAYAFFMVHLCSQPEFRPTDLTLHYVRLDQRWIRSAQLEKLKSIVIVGRFANAVDIIDFLRDKAELRSLKCSSTFSHILPEISATITNFERFETFSYFDLRFQVTDTVRIEKSIKLSNTSIKHLSIPLYVKDGSDLHLWLDKKNAIESLALQMCCTDVPLELESLAKLQASGLEWFKTWTKESFDKLTSVEIGIWTKKEAAKESQKQSDFMFILNFLSKLKNLKTVTINSMIKISDFYMILEYIPNIETITFSNLDLLHLSVEMEKFAMALKKLNVKRVKQQPVSLVISQLQYDELKVIISARF